MSGTYYKNIVSRFHHPEAQRYELGVAALRDFGMNFAYMVIHACEQVGPLNVADWLDKEDYQSIRDAANARRQM